MRIDIGIFSIIILSLSRFKLDNFNRLITTTLRNRSKICLLVDYTFVMELTKVNLWNKSGFVGVMGEADNNKIVSLNGGCILRCKI